MSWNDVWKKLAGRGDYNTYTGKAEEFKPPKITIWDGKDIEVAEKAEKKIQIAKIRAMEKVPFFGRMTLLLDTKALPNYPTMGTDGEYLYYNPNFINDSISADELVGVILHEVLHCAFLHLWRREKRNPIKWNMAADLAVNPIVLEEGLTLPHGILIDEQYYDQSAEMIYKNLPKLKTVKMQMSGDWFSDKSKWGKKKRNESKDGQTGKNDSKGGKKKKSGGDSSSRGKGQQSSASDVWRGKNKEVMEKLKDKSKGKKGGQNLEDFWKGVFESSMRGTSRGDMKGYMQRFWKELEAKKDWKKLLTSYLSSSTDDFNFSAPDRRFLEEDFYLPDLQDEENIEDVVIAVDTSGSISTWQFNHFISEVKEILRVFPKFKGWFIDCDCDVNQVLEIKPTEEFKPQMKGGGGTDFNPVFRRIEKEQWNPRVLIYLTDGYGLFPNEKPDYPVIWLIDSEVEPPFGEKVQYEYEPGDEQEN